MTKSLLDSSEAAKCNDHSACAMDVLFEKDGQSRAVGSLVLCRVIRREALWTMVAVIAVKIAVYPLLQKSAASD